MARLVTARMGKRMAEQGGGCGGGAVGCGGHERWWREVWTWGMVQC